MRKGFHLWKVVHPRYGGRSGPLFLARLGRRQKCWAEVNEFCVWLLVNFVFLLSFHLFLSGWQIIKTAAEETLFFHFENLCLSWTSPLQGDRWIKLLEDLGKAGNRYGKTNSERLGRKNKTPCQPCLVSSSFSLSYFLFSSAQSPYAGFQVWGYRRWRANERNSSEASQAQTEGCISSLAKHPSIPAI